MPSLRVYTFGHEHLASTRFRFKAIESALAERFSMTSSEGRPRPTTLFSDRKYDAIYLQKVLPSLVWWRGLRIAGRQPHVVYDFDDAIWERPGKARSLWSRTRLDWRLKSAWANADVVTTCSEYLASYGRPYAKKLMVIPIAIARPAAPKPSSARTLGPRCIGWSGHPSGIFRLKAIDEALAAFLAKHPNFSMLVLSGSRPDMNAPFEWLKWNPQVEAEYFARVSIGVVPLENEGIDKGKSPVKIIQHLAQGVPIVTNGLGGTEEIASGGGVVHIDGTPTSWIDALTSLASDPIEYVRIASDGLRNFEANYDVAVARQRFLSAFQIPSS